MGFNKEVFAANLRAARAKLDISQDEFAKRVGISKDSVVKYESGEGYIPGADKIDRFVFRAIPKPVFES